MAHIAFFAPNGPGHVNPLLGTAAELVRRGHRVTFAAPEEFAARVTETGAEHVPTPTTWRGGGDAPQMHGRGFVRAVGLLLEEIRVVHASQVDRQAPDLVVHDGTLAWWGRLLAHRWQVPAVENWPNLVSNEHWGMHQEYTKFNPMSPRFLLTLFRMARFARAQGVTDVAGFLRGSGAALRLVTLPRAFQYEGDTFADTHLFVGPDLTARAARQHWTPPTDDPVLLVSLGTAYNDRPDLYREIARSAAGRPWHVVMAIGGTDPADLGELAPNVEVHAQVPQLAVLRHATVFVTHAGMGGTMEGLAHEVPLVALPQMAEQRANADRVAELGLGRALDPDTVDAATLWAAVEEVAHDPAVRERLGWMREQITEAGGAVAAADAVEGLLTQDTPTL
ncbi:macrolide family glycosyltransferase [Nocardiopsis sp. MG754419]|uniref:macrolide family glycosyltransferase n=1 Tax=Nocardiopsis sp. MG754419 TaxID=2259865 RepID=UPI001BA87621|nr:macrolide family glycosyltransferase [Nocardiopsis sp. MG754419]MBR8743651.1 glycosyl transferase [Nocardiopsis sp. MG754419]